MLVVREEVAAALGRGQPVVALESTLIAHGCSRILNAPSCFFWNIS